MPDKNNKEKTEFWLAMLLDFGIPAVFAIFGFMISRKLELKAQEEIIITTLFFLVPLIVIYLIKLELKGTSGSFIKRQHFIDKSLKSGDSVISALLTHLSEDCFNRCSNFSDRCAGCKNFSQECNGLLRNYLLEECRSLQSSINMAKRGQYQLSTNIERFHTIALDHLIGARSKEYSVIHWFGGEEAKEETYSELDFHFLSALLTKLTDVGDGRNGKSYIDRVNFKIRWLLIGDIEHIKNTYDYIFHVVDQLGLNDLAGTLFEFHHMSDAAYKNRMTAELAQLSPFLRSHFNSEPNVGIFGSYFMFAESQNNDEHGIIYTQLHNATANQGGSVSEALSFYNKALSKSGSTISYTTLKTKYDTLPEEHRTEILATRCKSQSRNN